MYFLLALHLILIYADALCLWLWLFFLVDAAAGDPPDVVERDPRRRQLFEWLGEEMAVRRVGSASTAS